VIDQADDLLSKMQALDPVLGKKENKQKKPFMFYILSLDNVF